MTHYDVNGNVCNCRFGQYNEQVDESLVKEAGAKLDWIRDREDKFSKTEEGQKMLNLLDHLVNDNEKIDSLVPWLWREAKKNRFDDTPRGVDSLSHMADWFASNSPTRRGVDIMQLTWDDVTAKVTEWDEELGSKDADVEKAGGEIVHDFGDGWTIRKLTTAEEAKVEGDAMGHCVGGYGSEIEAGRTSIFSLRDSQNQPHATIEIDPWGGDIKQIQGKGNKNPIPEYQERVGNWLLSFENPPAVKRYYAVETFYAPETVEDLWSYVQLENGYLQTHESAIAPTSWQDFFNTGEDGLTRGREYWNPLMPDDEGYEDISEYPEGIDIHPIDNIKNLEAVASDAFNANGSEKMEMLAEILEDNNAHMLLNEDQVNTIRNFVYDIAFRGFQQIIGNLGGELTHYEAWNNNPFTNAIDRVLGYSFIDKNTDEPIGSYIPPAPPNPNQNELFFAPKKEYGETEEPAPILWNDPKNPDNQAGKFSKLLARLRRNKKANILDEVYGYLDPEIWKNCTSPMPALKEELAEWIPQFITEALERNGYTDMGDWLSFVLTGSLTTYQYSDKSDCDISLFVNAEMFPEWSRAEMIAIMMDECDGTFVPGTGHELQCYVVPSEFTREDLYKPGMRSAYDIMERRWIVPPEKDRSHNVKSEMNEAYTIALENSDKMEKLIRYEPLKAIKYYEQIHRRRRRDMQAGSGDFSPSNISYKMMEDRGLFDQVHSLMKQHERAY